MPHRPLLPPLQPLLFRPAESNTGFDFAAVVDEARAIWFPELEDQVEVRFAAPGPLAFIIWHLMGPRRHVMAFHPIFNQPGVPIEVVRQIAKHELTHIACPPVRHDWGWDSHHPAFWEREYAIAPERWNTWAWIRQNLGPAIRRTPHGLIITKNWRRRTEGRRLAPYTPHLPFEDIPWQQLCPEGGAQLRLPPEWAWRPALAAMHGTR